MTHVEAMPAGTTDRRAGVLDSALTTFARFGYRKTSMDAIARSADISRPGLYFLFASKEELFRAAVLRGLEDDLSNAEAVLGERDRPIRARVLAAFDLWAGRYVGPGARDLAAVIDESPGLLGEIVVDLPQRFADLVTAALVASLSGESAASCAQIAQMLISASIGIKHQVEDRVSYNERFAVAVDLLVR